MVSQLGRPRGPLGRALAKVMNRSNLNMSKHALAQLQVKPGQTILEIGFGGGVSLPLLLEAVGPEGKVIGVDRAPAMLAVNQKAFGDRISLFRAELPAWPTGLPLADGILAVNVVYFWTEPQASLNTLFAALKPGGRISLGFRPPEVARVMGLDKAGFNTVEPDLVLSWLKNAGFEGVGLQSMAEGKFLAHAAVGHKPVL